LGWNGTELLLILVSLGVSLGSAKQYYQLFMRLLKASATNDSLRHESSSRHDSSLSDSF
jgi:hypothetical protein